MRLSIKQSLPFKLVPNTKLATNNTCSDIVSLVSQKVFTLLIVFTSLRTDLDSYNVGTPQISTICSSLPEIPAFIAWENSM